MFPFRDVKVHDGENEETPSGTRSDEVSSTIDEFDSVRCFEHNYELDNIDPSLFCPDIILELGDAPVLVGNDRPNSNQKTENNSGSNSSVVQKKKEKLDGAISSTCDLVTKEIEFRKKTFGSANRVQYTKIHCTACYDHLGSALSDHDNRLVHPLLKVLICKECYDFYASGEFETEDDGSEIYCRWCGQGGQVVCCSTCQFVFCTDCIETNLGKEKLEEIEANDDWVCFGCDPSQIVELRGHCAELLEYTEKEMSRIRKLANAQSLMKIDYSNCCPSLDLSKVGKMKRKPKNSVDPTYTPSNRSRKQPLSNKIGSEGNQLEGIPKSIAPKEKSSGNDGQSLDFNKTSPSPSKMVLAPSILPEPQTLQDGQTISTQQKTQAINVVQNCVDQEDLCRKRSFYKTTIQSVSNANADFYRDMLLLKDSKTVGLEEMVVAHNKLHEVLNRSIRSLTQIQKLLAEHKPDISNAIKELENITNEDDGKGNKIIEL